MAASGLKARDTRLDDKGVWMETTLWGGDEKLWPAPPSNELLSAARARIHRGCVEPCPDQTDDSCPTQSRPSMQNALPVAHAPSLPGATRFFVLGFTDVKRGFVASCHNDGAKTTSPPLPLFSHHWCTGIGTLPISMAIQQWPKFVLVAHNLGWQLAYRAVRRCACA